MRFAATSHAGLVRPINQDGYRGKIDLGEFGAVLVADGMGGHRAGEVASALALDVVEEELKKNVVPGVQWEHLEDVLRDAIVTANRRVYRRAQSERRFAGMGTTIVAALFNHSHICVAHIGDSRAYLMNRFSIRQLTDDHSLVNELWKSGRLTEEEAQKHPRKNVLTRALGTSPDVELDLVHQPWGKGDKLLLCSDGLTNLLANEEIHALLYTDDRLEGQLQSLLALALERGGHDNITIAAVENGNADEKRGEPR